MEINIGDGSMDLVEKVDMTTLRIIRDNFEEVFKRMGGKMKVFNISTKHYEECCDFKQSQTLIQDFYLKKRDTDKVSYRFSARLQYGRRFSNLSLQGCHRPIRHAISKDLYYDIDMKNCHPVILQNKCTLMQFNHPQLDYYISNREECLSIIMNHFSCDKEMAKSMILKIMNGGGSSLENLPSFLEEFRTRQYELLDEFYNYSKYPTHQKYVQRAINNKNKDFNKRGSALNYYLCEIENILLTYMEHSLQQQGIRYGALCFDGIMIYKADVIGDTIEIVLRNIEATFPFPMHLSVKEMNESVDLTGLQSIPDIDISDVGYSEFILHKFHNDIKYHSYSKTLYKYNEELTLWTPLKIESLITFIPSICIPYIKTSPDLSVIEKEIKDINTSQKQRNILYQLKSRIEMRHDDEFINSHFDICKGFFPLNNNLVMDFREYKTRRRTKEDYFTKTTERNFIELTKKEDEYIYYYYMDMLTNYLTGERPSKNYVSTLIMCMAYTLTGENNLKRFINLIGNGNNGKSVFVELHQSIMGLNIFSVTGNKRVFIQQQHSSNHDSEAISLIGSRMVVVTELKKKEAFNEEFLKSITGGDYISLRNCGVKEVINVMFQCIPWFATNEVPNFESEAFKNRLLCFNFSNKFENNPAKVDELRSHLDHFFSFLCSYAKTFYDNGRTINYSSETLIYTESIKTSKDVFLNWTSEQDFFEMGEKTDFVIKEEIYSSFVEFYKLHNKEGLGKNTFFKRFEEYFKLDKAKEKTLSNTKPYVYFGIHKI